jgi:hypothetical protein
MTGTGVRSLSGHGLDAAEAALDLFFETWRLAAGSGDPLLTRRLGLGALRVVQRVTAIGLEETRAGGRQRVREARVELRRLVNAVGQGGRGAEGQTDTVRRWDALAASVGHELSRLNQVLCAPEAWIPAESARPLAFDHRPQAHDSRLATHD